MCGLPTTAADSSAASDRWKCIQTKPLILPPRGPVWGSSGAVSGRSRDRFEGLVSYESWFRCPAPCARTMVSDSWRSRQLFFSAPRGPMYNLSGGQGVEKKSFRFCKKSLATVPAHGAGHRNQLSYLTKPSKWSRERPLTAPELPQTGPRGGSISGLV